MPYKDPKAAYACYKRIMERRRQKISAGLITRWKCSKCQRTQAIAEFTSGNYTCRTCIAARTQRWKEADPIRYCESKKRERLKHKDRYAKCIAEWQAKNKDRRNLTLASGRAELADWYVRHLVNGMRRRKLKIPPELLEVMRWNLALGRAAKCLDDGAVEAFLIGQLQREANANR
jgi:hypothetical protein